MEPRVTLITLGVESIQRSRNFYTALGLPVRPETTEDVVFLELKGMWLSLYPRESLAKDIGIDAAGSGFAGITLAHNVRSRAAVLDVLSAAEAAGGRIVKAAQDVFWGGYSGYFADPDGFLWEIAWNPHFWIE